MAARVPHHKNLKYRARAVGLVAGRAGHTASAPLGALRHAVGIVRIMIDFRARTKAHGYCSFSKEHLSINLSVA
jgi:hypothetical protein